MQAGQRTLEKGRRNTRTQWSKEKPTAQPLSTQRRSKKDSAAQPSDNQRGGSTKITQKREQIRRKSSINHSEVNSRTQTKTQTTLLKLYPDAITKRHQQNIQTKSTLARKPNIRRQRIIIKEKGKYRHPGQEIGNKRQRQTTHRTS